jgi:hypothetical protein
VSGPTGRPSRVPPSFSDETSYEVPQSVTTERRMTRPQSRSSPSHRPRKWSGSRCRRCSLRRCGFFSYADEGVAIAAIAPQMWTACACWCRWRGDNAPLRPPTSSRGWIGSRLGAHPGEWPFGMHRVRQHRRLRAASSGLECGPGHEARWCANYFGGGVHHLPGARRDTPRHPSYTHRLPNIAETPTSFEHPTPEIPWAEQLVPIASRQRFRGSRQGIR